MLLVRPGAPRSVWQKHAPDTRPGELDHAAIAEVIGTDPQTVRVALEGGSVPADLLERFVEAFDLSPRHADRLHDLLRGSPCVRVISGDALSDLFRHVGPARHETVSVHELHTLGPDGLPAEHQTIQVIRSTVDGLDLYPYRFDTDQVVVHVIRGGQVGDMYRFGEGLYGVDIVLDRPLNTGETALMHYRSSFLYATPPPPEFRRGVLGSMRDVTLWVQFHPERLPRRLFLARWDRLNHAKVIEEQAVELDAEFSVQARYDRVEDSIVGFHWDW
jgi:hypothetical protein